MRGLCPRCLVATTTARWAGAREAAEGDEDEALEAGALVGVNGRFLLLDKLGEGGMGEVWLSKDRELSQAGEDHLVALKFISKPLRRYPRALAAIRTEVLRSQGLSHPNIVRIFDLHVTDRKVPFIKMEFVDGNSLNRWVQNAPNRIMPWRMVAHIARQLASALVYAHQTVHIVHRDIKPGNLLLAQGTILKLSDFGLAQSLRDSAPDAGDGSGSGTLWYASPQQIAGEIPSPADDIYSLGATLYELLTGTPPFEGENAEQLIQAVKFQVPEPIPQRLRRLGVKQDIPPKLISLVHRCLEKDPQCRPKTQEVGPLLPTAIQVGPVPGAPGSAPGAVWDDAPRPATRRWPGVVLALLLVGFVGWGWWANWLNVRTQLVAWWRPPTPAHFTPAEPAPLTESNETPASVLSPPVEQATPPQAPPSAPTNSDIVSSSVPAPPPTVEYGAIEINVLPAPDSPGKYYDAVAIDSAGNRGSKSWRSATHISISELKTGTCIVRVWERDASGKALGTDHPVERLVGVTAGEVAAVPVPFGRAEYKVTSDPPGAWVEWPSVGILTETSHKTPFTYRFPSGNLWLTSSLPGHFLLVTNYFFDWSVSKRADLKLEPCPFPMRGQDWTNALGMAFRWIEPLGLWACQTETRVGDYRQFARSQDYDTTTGLYSVTSTGPSHAGHSWQNPGPGFRQGDEYPVVGVNYQDAMRFCLWLETNCDNSPLAAQHHLSPRQHYWLPRTNEWFALAGNYKFPWGDDPSQLSGNYAGREVRGSPWPQAWPVIQSHADDYPRTAPVYSLAANALGLYHIGGNVAEWCAEGVLCGHSWKDGDLAHLEDLATRSVEYPADLSQRFDYNGFRVIIYEDKP